MESWGGWFFKKLIGGFGGGKGERRLGDKIVVIRMIIGRFFDSLLGFLEW